MTDDTAVSRIAIVLYRSLIVHSQIDDTVTGDPEDQEDTTIDATLNLHRVARDVIEAVELYQSEF